MTSSGIRFCRIIAKLILKEHDNYDSNSKSSDSGKISSSFHKIVITDAVLRPTGDLRISNQDVTAMKN